MLHTHTHRKWHVISNRTCGPLIAKLSSLSCILAAACRGRVASRWTLVPGGALSVMQRPKGGFLLLFEGPCQRVWLVQPCQWRFQHHQTMHTFSAVGLSAGTVFTETVARTKSVMQVGTSHVPALQQVMQNLSSVSHNVLSIPATDVFMVTEWFCTMIYNTIFFTCRKNKKKSHTTDLRDTSSSTAQQGNTQSQ